MVKVRTDAPLELLGPLGCGVQTGAGAVLNDLRVKPGRTIAIFGVGAAPFSRHGRAAGGRGPHHRHRPPQRPACQFAAPISAPMT